MKTYFRPMLVLISVLLVAQSGFAQDGGSVDQEGAKAKIKKSEKHADFKDLNSYDKYDAFDIRSYQTTVGIIGLGLGIKMDYAVIENTFKKHPFTLKEIKLLKQGAPLFFLTDKEMDSIWSQYARDEMQAVDVAKKELKSITIKMKKAGDALANSSILPSQVDVDVNSKTTYNHGSQNIANSNQVDQVHKRNSELFEKYSDDRQTAIVKLKDAEVAFEVKKISFFEPTNTSVPAQLVRNHVNQYITGKKWKMGGNAFWAAIGIYFIVASSKRLLIVMNDKNPGWLPLISPIIN